MTAFDLAQLECAVRLLIEVKHREAAGLKDSMDVDSESQALTALLAVLARHGIDLHEASPENGSLVAQRGQGFGCP